VTPTPDSLNGRLRPLRTSCARYALPLALAVAAACPVAFIAARVVAASRNIAFWDDYDSVLGFVLRFHGTHDWSQRLAQLFALEAEHRTATSRLIVLTTYWLTGAVNFNVIGVVGNLCLVGLCALLVASAGSAVRSLQLGVVLAFGLFQLEHYEPFLWSGASIDHFLILLLAGGAFFFLTRESKGALVGAGLLAGLATFTLSHGCLVWVVGGAMLWQARRWRALIGWSVVAGLTLAFFLHGFEVHAAHRIGDLSFPGLLRLGRFWLALLGGPLTFGEPALAPWFGLALVSTLGWLLVRGGGKREPLVLPLALFTVGSLALVAYGRFAVAGPHIESRYLVLGSLAWSLTAFMVLTRWTNPLRPFRSLAVGLPALIGFNVAATLHAAPFAETFLISRDYAAVRYKQFGEDGHAGGFQLHPCLDTAKRILAATSAQGIYRLPRFCEPTEVSPPRANPAMVTYVTDLTATKRAVGFEGWAMIPERESKRGQIHVVLRSEKSFLVFSTLSMPRPDVAKAFGHPEWRYCGYNFVTSRHRLPRENFQIGLLIDENGRTELKMTEQRLDLSTGQ
jgi:hypothetical protein